MSLPVEDNRPDSTLRAVLYWGRDCPPPEVANIILESAGVVGDEILTLTNFSEMEIIY